MRTHLFVGVDLAVLVLEALLLESDPDALHERLQGGEDVSEARRPVAVREDSRRTSPVARWKGVSSTYPTA